jgi:hypothetical protein
MSRPEAQSKILPDFALIDDGQSVGTVAYERLSISWQESNIIEDGIVPQDTQVVGQTWKHPNKNGGSDRRFRNNRQVPICRYEAMHLRSDTGINELVEFSRIGVAGAPRRPCGECRGTPKRPAAFARNFRGESTLAGDLCL